MYIASSIELYIFNMVDYLFYFTPQFRCWIPSAKKHVIFNYYQNTVKGHSGRRGLSSVHWNQQPCESVCNRKINSQLTHHVALLCLPSESTAEAGWHAGMHATEVNHQAVYSVYSYWLANVYANDSENDDDGGTDDDEGHTQMMQTYKWLENGKVMDSWQDGAVR